MSNEGFVTWLRHFVDFVKPTVVLIPDSHVTNTKNLVATDMAREAGVVIWSQFRHT